MTKFNVVSRDAWLRARKELLAAEKALTRQRDQVTQQRQALPVVRLDKNYQFDAPSGAMTMNELFGDASQLIVYHFMLGPNADLPCRSCSFWAEQYDAIRVHLIPRDANLVCVSRAPLARIEQVRARMGWQFPWVSSDGSDFNADFGVTYDESQSGQLLHNFGTQAARVGESPGLSVFVRDGGEVFHSYSTYSRGLDPLNATYQMLDLVPKGRDESQLPWPMSWVKLKYEYGR
jgi:predicted dithiol-disulfide oxidoreductase (DUF899 family)